MQKQGAPFARRAAIIGGAAAEWLCAPMTTSMLGVAAVEFVRFQLLIECGAIKSEFHGDSEVGFQRR